MVFLLGCYGCIFHGTANSAQFFQNLGISGGGGGLNPPRYATGLYCCGRLLCSSPVIVWTVLSWQIVVQQSCHCLDCTAVADCCAAVLSLFGLYCCAAVLSLFGHVGFAVLVNLVVYVRSINLLQKV
jgi:hypothetical protein